VAASAIRAGGNDFNLRLAAYIAGEALYAARRPCERIYATALLSFRFIRPLYVAQSSRFEDIRTHTSHFRHIVLSVPCLQPNAPPVNDILASGPWELIRRTKNLVGFSVHFMEFSDTLTLNSTGTDKSDASMIGHVNGFIRASFWTSRLTVDSAMYVFV
jgi:hypothetical protein